VRPLPCDGKENCQSANSPSTTLQRPWIVLSNAAVRVEFHVWRDELRSYHELATAIPALMATAMVGAWTVLDGVI
jgi:hypothetical protein